MRPETSAAIDAVSISQRIADSRKGASDITSKGGLDLVTGADVACEDAIRSLLLERFPDYPVIGEERGGEPVSGKPYWLVDPICGTGLYAANIPLYCSNIALVENGRVTLAAVGFGRTGEILFAEEDKGAVLKHAGDDQLATVSDRSKMILVDGNRREAGAAIQQAMLRDHWAVWILPSTIAYAFLAVGRVAGLIQFASGLDKRDPPGSVHTAAGCFLAREAGAIVTDLKGNDWTLLDREHIIASTPQIWEELRKLVQRGANRF